jgi:hypothetical protein
MVPSEDGNVKVAAVKKQKNEAELLDHATNNLLRAVKQRILKREGQMDYDKLRKEGYSERFIAKVEQA